jgi:hypothetical protein
MTWKVDSKVATSWLERARPEGAMTFAPRPEPGSSVDLRPGDPRQGWDPYGVWLRHIHEPRLRRDASRE